MFAKTAELITKKLQENDSISNEQYEICKFGFQQGLTIVLNIVTIAVIGFAMKELRLLLLFMILNYPLRSNAGGYHAKTAVRCYIYSALLMIAILLAMKYLTIPHFICSIILSLSTVTILLICPVEDINKPFDELEQRVYRKRTYYVTTLECFIFAVALIFQIEYLSICIMWVFLTISVILCIGKCKNILKHTFDMAQSAKNK